METNLTLVIVAGVLVAAGVTLVLDRSLTRILIGFILVGNGINVMFLVASGPAGEAPIVGLSDGRMSDPLPQAMVLTAIVITLGTTAFGLALAYRSWQITGHDDVQDDVEDAMIRRLAELDEASATFDESTQGTPDEEGADVPDEEGADAPHRGRDAKPDPSGHAGAEIPGPRESSVVSELDDSVDPDDPPDDSDETTGPPDDEKGPRT